MDPTMSLAGLWRYPVKSMLGERLTTGTVGGGGLDGDRRMALLQTVTGLVASAKHPRRWRRLLTLRATGATPASIRLTLPDGTVLRATDPEVDRLLTDLLGEPVTLTGTPPPAATLDRADPDEVLRAGIDAEVPVESTMLGTAAPAGTFFDFAPIHLITTTTLARLTVGGPGPPIDPVRYRPNLLLANTGDGFPENDWVGRELAIGSEVLLRVVAPTPRCAVPTLRHGDLPAEPAALRLPARLNRIAPLPQLGPQPCVGAYAQVVRSGRIRVGDQVRLR